MEENGHEGVCGFYFNASYKIDRIELMKLTQHLWDGDWCEKQWKSIII